VLVAAWWANMNRLLTTAASSPARRERLRTRASFVPAFLRFLPPSRRTAVAAKELRLLSREPVMRSQRILTGVFAVGAVVAVALVGKLRHPEVVLATAGFLWYFNIPSLNQFAPDRAAYWMNVAAGGDPREDLVGKNLAAVVLHVPVFAALATAVAAVTGGWSYLPLAVCLGAAVLGCQFCLGNLTSVRFPVPLPESANPWASRSGQGLVQGLIMLGAFLGSGLLVAPVAGLIGAGIASSSSILLWIAAPLAIAYGGAAYVGGLRVASKWLRDHQPEVLAALSPSKAV
jgi:hypothetical protein